MGDRIRRSRGGFELRLPRAEREVLQSLPGELRQLIESKDASTTRLFPPAYEDDPERQAEYQEMVGDELLQKRLQALEIVEQTVQAKRLDEEQLLAWLGALNDLRLVLGTRLGIEVETDGEDIVDDDPRAPVFGLYHYLGWLESQAVDALAEGIDPAGTVPD
jgi:Domain of unknown function (DUF2017)